MSGAAGITRRDFIKVASVAGGGLLLGFRLGDAEPAAEGEEARAGSPEAAAFEPNAWLRIVRDGTVTVIVAKSEMGQGVRTSLPMIVAEELEADWTRVRVEPALVDARYGNMTTGGSTSVRTSWETLRRAGAVAREMLIAAAAATWGVERAACRAERGTVVHALSGRRLAYGELAAKAAGLPVPAEAPLKDPREFRLIGRSTPRLDTPDKVTGRAVFGLDARAPGMLVAVVARSPVIGGKVKSFDATRARAVRGVREVTEIPSGVAVVADSTGAALRGREALDIAWDEGEQAALASAEIRRLFEERSARADGVARQDGEVAAALAGAARKVEAVYEVPYLAHATMEPMNCVADVRADGAEIWAPTQAPQWVQTAAAGAAGLPPEKVKVHTTLLGGGFGRRTMWDFVEEAALLSRAMRAPVQVVWTREDDMRHDFYRPASYHRLAAGLDAGGRLLAWSHRVVAPSIMKQLFPGRPEEGPPDVVSGAAEFPYASPHVLVDYALVDPGVRVGWWRSVYESQNAFVNECFLDEVAAAAGADPFEFRRRLLPEGTPLRRALELAAEKAGWGKAAPAGRGRGIAGHTSFGSSFAQVADVSVDGAGEVRVHRVVCALDCGPVVNPDTVAFQAEGAIVFGLSAALRGEITLERGRVRQGNFDDYPILTQRDAPEVEVHIVASDAPLGGIGEPGLPPAAPAVVNAIFAATGKRVRRLPVRADELKG